MVATKAALSIRVDALTDADGKSEETAPTIGIENRAKLEARLRALESGLDAAAVRSARTPKHQQKFQMTGEASTYNAAADLVPTQREPVEAALQAALDVKEEKKKAKEERKAKKKAEKEAKKDNETEESEDENRMDVDGETPKKKRKHRDGEANGGEKKIKVSSLTFVLRVGALIAIFQHDGETEEERKARKKAKKAAKEAAAVSVAESDGSKKKRKKSEA